MRAARHSAAHTAAGHSGRDTPTRALVTPDDQDISPRDSLWCLATVTVGLHSGSTRTPPGPRSIGSNLSPLHIRSILHKLLTHTHKCPQRLAKPERPKHANRAVSGASSVLVLHHVCNVAPAASPVNASSARKLDLNGTPHTTWPMSFPHTLTAYSVRRHLSYCVFNRTSQQRRTKEEEQEEEDLWPRRCHCQHPSRLCRTCKTCQT